MLIPYEIVCKDYEKESNDLINTLRNSDSVFKDLELDKVKWFYSFSYFINKGENTAEYYEALYKMPYDERLEAELKKVRVSLAISGVLTTKLDPDKNYLKFEQSFYLTDRVSEISDMVKQGVKAVTIQKMVNEAEFTGDDSVLKSIPFVTENEIPKPMSFDEQLIQAIDNEDYEEAARIRDLMSKHGV